MPVGSGRLDVVSMGLLVDDETDALMWRGLILNRAVQHFLEDVAWADDLDYLVIDLPPGTGDVQMGLARMLPQSEMIVVTTPALAAQRVASRAVTMARKSHLHVLGVIENMSAFRCEHGDLHAVFGEGGGAALAAEAQVPLIGTVPLEPAVSAGGDAGAPVSLGEGDAADALRAIADRLVDDLAPPVAMAGCSARMLAAATAALDAATHLTRPTVARMSRGRRALGLVAIGLSLGAVACSGGAGTEVRGTGDEEPVDLTAAERASEPLLDLAVELEQQLATASPGSDLTVAALPVAMSLSQARSGAEGDTAAELDRVLHTPDGPDGPEQLAAGLSSLDRLVASRAGEQRDTTGRTGTVAIDLAQSLWLQKGTTIEREWLDGLATTWGSGVRTTDFRSDPETARKAVNGWVADATNDHIDQLAPRGTISPTTRILAAGAAYLKAPWVTPFADTETRLAPFRHLDGSVSTVSMMRNPDLTDARYGAGDGWVAVDLPYLGRSLWLTVIVPDEGRFTDVERGLDGEGLRELLRSLAPTTLDLGLPKFGFTTDTPLTDALRSLGLTIATDPFAADFSGISSEPLSLTSVLHQTYLAIAEQGTEATATNPKPPATTPTTGATTSTTSTSAPTTTASAAEGPLEGVDTTTTSSMPATITPAVPKATVVTVDRPFLVLVRDRPTGAALFYGRVLSPNG